MAKRVGVIFEVSTSGTSQRLAEVDFQLQAINDQLRQAKKLGQTDVYAGLKDQQAKLKAEARDLNKALRDQQTAFNAAKFPEDSLIGLTNKYRQLRREIDALSASQRKSDFGQSLINQARGIKGQIDSIGSSVGDFRSQVGNYKGAVIDALQSTGLIGSNVKALFAGGGIIEGVGIAIGAVASGARALFEINRDISASQAAVQKTTGLTADEVDRLTENLKALDTPTTLGGLLEISAIAGQLGITGVDGVEAFTKSVDNLVVALGDDFGGGADVVTDQVGRLSNVLFGATTDGDIFAQRLTNLGNALNTLAANGAATAPVITDFSNRIAALAVPLGVSQGTILGISATLQELGVTAERGGTAVGRIFQALTTDADSFAEALEITPQSLADAGFQAGSFAELVNSDLSGALQFASSRVLSLSENNIDLATRLKEVGITGAGELEVFLKLGQANERLSANIDTATTALQNQDSILQEVEARNTSLAGASQRLGNAFKELFVQAGIENFFARIIEAIIPVVNFFGQVLPAIFTRVGEILSPLINAFRSLFSAIFDGTTDFSFLKQVGDLLVGTLVFVVDTVSALVSGLASAIRTVKDFISQNAFLSKSFEILRTVITAPFVLLSKLPALLNGIGSAFRQLKDNITSLDFSKSIGDAFKEGYNRAQLGSLDLQKQLDDTEKSVNSTTAAVNDASIATSKLGQNTNDASAALNGLDETTKETTKSVEKLARGSIAYLNKQLSDLKGRLDKSPNATVFNQISEQIQKTEDQLAETQARFERFRDAQRGITGVVNQLSGPDQTAEQGIQSLIQQLDLEGRAELDKRRQLNEAKARLDKEALDNLREQRKDSFDQQLADEQEFLQSQFEVTNDLYSSIGEITGQFLSGQTATFEDFIKQIIITAIDATEKLIQLQLAQAFGVSLAQADSIATFGATGLARFAIISGLIKGFFAGVKSLVQSFDQGGEIRAYSGQRVGSSRRMKGPGRDSVLIHAFPGEVMLNPEQQSRLKAVAGRGIFKAIGVPGFQDGGIISNTPQIINPNVSLQGQSSGVTIDEQVFKAQAQIIAAEVSRQVGLATETAIFGASERTDRRRQLMKDREV